jgi:hypothetical protein
VISFALIGYYAGWINPYDFKLTNMVIHLLNGLGLYCLSLWLLRFHFKQSFPDSSIHRASLISVFVASAWLLHPLNLTSVLYVVQRMTSLSAFFSIYGLAFYVYGRSKAYYRQGGYAFMLIGVALFTPAAMFSKENGVLLPFLMLITEGAFFKFRDINQKLDKYVIGYFALFTLIPSLIAAYWLSHHLSIFTAGYVNRAFTLSERLFTEARVVWYYARQVLLPNVGDLGLYQDDIEISRSLLQPVSTLFSVIGLMGALVAGLLLRKKAPVFTFAVLFFLVGHSLESSFIPLEIAFEHRNYLPMYGLLLAAFHYSLHPAINNPRVLKLSGTCAVLLVLAFGWMTHIRAEAWSNPYDLAKWEVTHHPNSVRANTDMADVLDGIKSKTPEGDELNYQAEQYFYERSVALDKNNTYGLLSLIISNSMRNKPVKPEWVDQLKARLASAPQPPTIGTKLGFLVRCQDSGACKLGQAQIEGILKAPLANPTLTPLNQGEVRLAWATYLINIAHDYASAKRYMYEMANLSHEPLHRLTLARFLIAIGDTNEAQEQLNIVKRDDTNHVFTQQLADVEKSLMHKVVD